MLIGLQRARVDHEIEPVRSFRRARVSLIDDRLDNVGQGGGRARESTDGSNSAVDTFRPTAGRRIQMNVEYHWQL